MSIPNRPRELWFVGPREVEIRRRPEASEPGAGQVLVRALASGISQGTELLLYRGDGPSPFDPSLDAPGAPTYPRRYGYAWVGEVVARGPGSRHDVGTRVFCLAPHGDLHLANDSDARPLPDGVPNTRAVLAANLETAVTCVWDAQIGLGDRVTVVGQGVVGLLVTWLARAAGARVCAAEPSPRRRQLALALGADEAVESAEAACHEGADVVVEATGDPRALDGAIACAADEGAIVVASFYGKKTSPVALGSAFHRRRLRLVATQVSRIPPRLAPRWTVDRRFAWVLGKLADPALDMLLEPSVDFERAGATFAALDAAPAARLQTVFSY